MASDQRRFGQYQILAPIGRGGMGIVYQAMDVTLERVVALKVLHDHLRASTHCVSRLQREARAIAALNHPNIVHIYSVGTIGKVAYFAMEYIEGRPLSTLMQQEGRLSWQRALAIASQTAEALTCAHAAGIIHRDIKPPNIILGKDDHVYVTDFGVAKVLTAETQLTIDASRLGTPSYMSPEHCQNGAITAASDFYSLGVLIFQMISGRLPHEASSRGELVNKIIGSPPARLRDYAPDVPEGVDRLVAHLLEKRPKDRPRDGETLCRLIDRVRHGETLDEGFRQQVATYATLRENLARAALLAPVAHGTPGTSGHDSYPEWVYSLWRILHLPGRPNDKRLRLGFLTMLATWAALCTAATAYLLYEWDSPAFYAEAGQHEADRWLESGDVAEFEWKDSNQLMARMRAARTGVTQCAWLENGEAVLELSSHPEEGENVRRILCLLEPDTRHATTRTVETAPQVPLLALSERVSRDTPLYRRLVFGYSDTSESLYTLFEAVPWETSHTLRLPVSTPPHAKLRAVSASVSPTGTSLALGLGDPTDGISWTVSRIDVGFAGASGPPEPLTSPGPCVTALQFAPDGQQIAYIRDAGIGLRELWLVRADGSESNGRRLAQGNLLLGPGAFSPSGHRILVTETYTGNSTELAVVNTDGSGTARLGPGSSACWHPSGTFVVAIAPDGRDRPQLFAVASDATARRQALTSLSNGVKAPCRVSPDGRWAIAVVETTGLPEVLFLNLATPPF